MTLLCKVLYFLKHTCYFLSMNAHATHTCPVAKTATLLSDTWTMLIIRDLLQKPCRFSELQTSLQTISSRTLTLKLKKLEEEKILTKEDFYYTLTKQGKKLQTVIRAMENWGKDL